MGKESRITFHFQWIAQRPNSNLKFLTFPENLKMPKKLGLKSAKFYKFRAKLQ